jgi:hypothetical protein
MEGYFPNVEAVLYDPNGITRENDRAEGDQRFCDGRTRCL